MTVDYIIVGAYLITILLVGLLSGKKLKNLKDFSVSTTKYGTFAVFATLSSSYIGGGFSTGNAAKVFENGVGNIFALWGFSLSSILVGRYIATKIDRPEGEISTGGIMGEAYGTPARVITGFLSVFLCAGILGAQVGAIGDAFEVFLGIPEWAGIAVGVSIVLLYSSFGGMQAVVISDIIQFSVLAAGIPLLILFGLHAAGGWSGLVSAVPEDHFNIFKGTTPLGFFSLFCTMMLGETLVPPYVQRLLIGKDRKTTARATLMSGLFSIPFIGLSGIVGLLALALLPGINPNQAMPELVRAVMPIGVRGFMISAVITIVMSSADSYLNCGAVGIVGDILTPLRKKEFSERSGLFLARFSNFMIGILAVAFAVAIPNVLDVLMSAYTFWCPLILVPLAAALMNRGAGEAAFYAGFFGGLFGILFVLIYNRLMPSPFPIDKSVVGFLTNLAAYCLAAKKARAKQDITRKKQGITL